MADFEPRLIARQSAMQARRAYGSCIGIVLTDQCNIRCSHCISDCGLERTYDLPVGILDRLIEDSATVPGVEKLAFTGGEPFLKRHRLRRALGSCLRLGLQTSVMTNGYWARDVGVAARLLARLPGLTQLGLSTDRFHQVFISVTRICNAIRAARELGISSFVRVSYLNNPAAEIAHVRTQLSAVDGMYTLEQQPVQPVGRAIRSISSEAFFHYDVNFALCQSADVPAVNVDGRVSACCGSSAQWPGHHSLMLGDLNTHTLAEVLANAELNTVLHALRLWGPIGLLRLAQTQAHLEDEELAAPSLLDICSLCHFVVTDTRARTFLEKALDNPTNKRQVAVTRLMELGEPPLLLALDELDAGAVT